MNPVSPSEGLFKSILNVNVREGVLCLSGAKVVFANEAFYNLFFKKSARQLSGVCLDDLFADRKLLNRLHQKAETNGDALEGPVECIADDDSRFYCDARLTHVNASSKELTVLTLCDITEMIRQERLLRSNYEELKKINSQLDRFLYSASHDIRQPLTSMMGLLRLVQMENPSLSENVYITRLNESVLKLDEFLHQVILFTRNSHVQVRAQRLDLCEVVKDRINALQSVQKEDVIPEFRIDVNGNFPFYSDYERLVVIIDHVLKNSIQYMDASKVRPFVKVLIGYGMHQVYIEVVDNGIGISKKHIGKVTEMFYRASTASKGSGLGLYIVKETISKLGGRITIDSEVGLGTIVIIEIPNDRKGILISKKRMLTADSTYAY